jgi:Flp pilus assembly protein TadD
VRRLALLLAAAMAACGSDDPPLPRAGSIEDADLAALFDDCASKVRAAPADAAAWAALAMAYQSNGFDAMAETCWRHALQLRPTDAKWWYAFALVLEREDRYDDAVAAARRAADIGPDYAPLHRSLAFWALGRGRLDEAEAAARRAVEISHNGSGALIALGRVQMEKGDDAAAEATFAAALAAWPEDWGAASYVRFLHGTALRRMGREDEAARELALGRGEPAALPDPWRAEVAAFRTGFEARLQRAHRLVESQSLDAAIDELQELRKKRPKNAQVLTDLAAAYLHSARWREAIAVLEECVAAHPGDLDPRLQLARASWAAGDRAAAMRHAQIAVDANPFSADALEARGMLHLRSGRGAPALTDFAAAARLDPTSATAHALGGAANLVLERIDEAKWEFDAALRLDPAQATAIAGLSICALKKGDLASADRELSRIDRLGNDAAPLVAEAREQRAAVK